MLRVLHRIGPTVAKRVPSSLRERVKRTLVPASPASGPAGDRYERLYEQQGATLPATVSVGDGDFDLIGRIELALLIQEGLRPDHTVVDFGCGTGRLAIHLVPFLDGGHYIGIDIARSMLERAGRLLDERAAPSRCRTEWVKQTSPQFALPDDCVDFMCAFSVFTHMEHEDSYRYLLDARRVVRPGGRFLLSCLPMSLPIAREIFLESAGLDLGARWNAVRNVTTTAEFMETIAELAGWKVARWYAGNELNVSVPDRGQHALGQSTCVLVRP